MTDASNTEWVIVIVIVLFGLLLVSSLVLGRLTMQVLVRLDSRGKGSSYRKWGVDIELFQPNSIVLLVGSGLFVIFSTIFTFVLAYLSTVLVSAGTTSRADQFHYTLLAALYAVAIGLMVEYWRVRRIVDKTRTLDDLRVVFHQRFSPSELLSMYEGLRSAPPLFWEEYADLPDDQVNQETNRSYRERATPYGHGRLIRDNRTVIVVAVLTLLLTAIVVVKQLFS